MPERMESAVATEEERRWGGESMVVRMPVTVRPR